MVVGRRRRHKLHLTLPEWFAAWLAGQSYDVWAREALWLGPGSWTREEAEERRRLQGAELDSELQGQELT